MAEEAFLVVEMGPVVQLWKGVRRGRPHAIKRLTAYARPERRVRLPDVAGLQYSTENDQSRLSELAQEHHRLILFTYSYIQATTLQPGGVRFLIRGQVFKFDWALLFLSGSEPRGKTNLNACVLWAILETNSP